MDATDRDALMALLHSTDGRNWGNGKGWNTDANLSTWNGVEMHDEGRVKKLSLNENNLRG